MISEIKCTHKRPISECLECYPVFLKETTVGEFLYNPAGLSVDTIAQGYSNRLLHLALNHNASIVEYASVLISAGPQDRKSHKKAIAEFKRIHREYNKMIETALDKAQRQWGDQ